MKYFYRSVPVRNRSITGKKPETVAFLGQDPVRCKVVVDNKCLQHVKNFKHLGSEISYGYEKHIQHKLAQFSQKLGIRNNTFKQNFVKKY